MAKQTLHYGDQRIPYRVLFVPGRRSRLSIHVHPDGSVQVEAPPETSLQDVKQAVSRRARWLSTQLDQVRRRRAHLLRREYVSGESHFYLGRRYSLKIRESREADPSVRLWRGQFQIVVPERNAETVQSLLWRWYREHARNVFDRRLASTFETLSWVKTAPRWRLLAMKKQWGSCSPHGVLSLNPHLVKAPVQCIDYVLLHELCHIKYHNHSREFYRLLARHMPEWEAVKGRLDDMAELLLNA